MEVKTIAKSNLGKLTDQGRGSRDGEPISIPILWPNEYP